LDKNLVRKEKINSCFSCLSWTKKNFRGQKPRPQGKKIRAFRAFRGQKKPFVDKNLVRKEKIIFALFVDKKNFRVKIIFVSFVPFVDKKKPFVDKKTFRGQKNLSWKKNPPARRPGDFLLTNRRRAAA